MRRLLLGDRSRACSPSSADHLVASIPSEKSRCAHVDLSSTTKILPLATRSPPVRRWNRRHAASDGPGAHPRRAIPPGPPENRRLTTGQVGTRALLSVATTRSLPRRLRCGRGPRAPTCRMPRRRAGMRAPDRSRRRQNQRRPVRRPAVAVRRDRHSRGRLFFLPLSGDRRYTVASIAAAPPAACILARHAERARGARGTTRSELAARPGAGVTSPTQRTGHLCQRFVADRPARPRPARLRPARQRRHNSARVPGVSAVEAPRWDAEHFAVLLPAPPRHRSEPSGGAYRSPREPGSRSGSGSSAALRRRHPAYESAIGGQPASRVARTGSPNEERSTISAPSGANNAHVPRRARPRSNQRSPARVALPAAHAR